jgi:hypothetical protein
MLAGLSDEKVASFVRIAADPGTRDLAAFGSCRRRERVDGTPPGPGGPRVNSTEESYSSGRLQRVFLLLQSSVVWLDAHVGEQGGFVGIGMLRPSGRHSRRGC